MDLVDRGDRLALRLARCGWGWWRPPAQRAEGHLMLPRGVARRLARKGGRVQIERVRRGQAEGEVHRARCWWQAVLCGTEKVRRVERPYVVTIDWARTAVR